MALFKNEDGFEAVSEFIKKPAVDLEAFLEVLDATDRVNSPLLSNPIPFIGTLDDLLNLPRVLVPFEFRTPEQERNNLTMGDIVLCERIQLETTPEDCPTCVRNPAAFVPDWRNLESGENFFDGKECKFSAVVDATIQQIPKKGSELETRIKISGILALLREFQKADDYMTAIFYVLNGQPEPEGIDLATLTSKTQADNFVGLQTASIELSGCKISDILAKNNLVNVGIPGKKIGYRRILKELDVIATLLETTAKDGNPAVSVAYYASPTPNTNTKALVSIDAEIFERVPTKLITKPKIASKAPSLEVTIAGSDYSVMFNDVSRNLKRANKFAISAQKSEDQQRFYLKDDPSDQPIVIDFKQEAKKLIEFRQSYLTPAIKKVLGIPIRNLGRVIIRFQILDNESLKITDVFANASGCPVVQFSEFLNFKEVQRLFDFNDSTTLGYVAALPDMDNYLKGKDDIVWLEFLVQFTYPGIEIKSPFALIDPGEDRTTEQCLADKSMNQIVNSFIQNSFGAPDLFLNSISNAICKTVNEVPTEKAQNQQAFSVVTNPTTRIQKLTGAVRKFETSIVNKVTNSGGIQNKTLVKTLLDALTSGIDSALSSDSDNNTITPQKIDLSDLTDIMNRVLGGWCGWAELTLEALDCLLKGMGVEDIKAAIVEQALKGLTPFQLQKLTQNLPPETAAKLQSTLRQTVGDASTSLLMPWQNNYDNSQTFDLQKETQTQLKIIKDERADGRRPLDPLGTHDKTLAMAIVNQQKQEFDKKRLNSSQSAGRLGSALGSAQKDLTNVFIKTMIDVVGLDTLYDLLSDVPGFGIVKKFISDMKCLLTSLPNINPPLDSFLKTLKVDLCQLGKGKVADITLPKFNPIKLPNGSTIEVTTAIKNFFKLLVDYVTEILIDIATQLLIQATTAIIETILDAICDLMAMGGAALSDLVSGNSKAKSDLKKAICDKTDVSDEELSRALKNILDALVGHKPENSCVAELTPRDMAQFIDAVLVTISYNQLYNLLLGNADPQTLRLIAEVARNLGSECIAQIFGNPQNIADYFGGLGILVDAENIFSQFPTDIVMPNTLNVCPPEAQETIQDLQKQLLTNKGLDQEDINEQLDFLKEQAAKKLQDLTNLLANGPFSDLPSLLTSGACPPTGLIKIDPAAQMASDLMMDSLLAPIEQRQMNDLLGGHGVLNYVLSDTEGKPLKKHRFLVNELNLGNKIGAENILFQFYSDDAMIPSSLEDDIVDINKSKRTDRFGETYADGDPQLALIKPIGGFPSTVGGFLFDKLNTFNVGLVDYDSVDNKGASSLVTFKTRMLDPKELETRDTNIEINKEIVLKRQDFIARWAAATHFVDYKTLKPYLFKELGNESANALEDSKESKSTQPSIEKRIGIFFDMINSCDQRINQVDPNATKTKTQLYSGIERVSNILINKGGSKNINVNGLIWGMNLEDKRDRIDVNKFDSLSQQETANFYNWLLLRNFDMTKELRDLYLEIYDLDGSTDYVKSISSLETIPPINPFELGMSFVSFPEKRFSPDNKTTDPDYAFDVTYDYNIQDETGLLDPANTFKFRTICKEKFYPFGPPLFMSIDDAVEFKKQKKDNKKELYDAANTLLPSPIQVLSQEDNVVFAKDITSTPNQQVVDLVNQFIGESDVSKIAFSAPTYFLNEWIRSIIDKTTGREISSISQKEMVDFHDFVNQGFVRRLSKRISEGDGSATIRSDGNDVKISNGFLFGYDETKQPEVIILDPAVYGGTNASPPFYIKPPTYDGWLGVVQKMLPEKEACEPRRAPIYSLDDIKKDTNQLFSKFKTDERLTFQPLCTKEAPYDSIYDNATLVSLEGIVRVTTRVYLMDFILKIVPVISQFQLNFDGNFDELLQFYLADKILDSLKEESPTSPRRNVLLDQNNNITVSGQVIPTKKYYYNFLEQVVQLIIKKVDSEILNLETDFNEDQRAAYNNIIATISSYYEDFEGTEATLSEEAIQSQDMFKRAINQAATRNTSSTLGRGSSNFDKIRAKRIKTGLLYATIIKTEEDAKTLYSLYIKTELEAMRARINTILNPTIDNLDLVMISDPNFISGHIRKKIITSTSGTKDSPPIYARRFDGSFDYEGPFDVMSNPKDPRTFNIALNEQQFGEDNEVYRWPFVLEKFIRIEDKDSNRLQQATIANLPGEISDREENLFDIVNINDWVSYLDSLPREIASKNITDYWSSWKFGLRLSMIVDENTDIASSLLGVKLPVDLATKSMRISTPEGTKILIPLAVGELPVNDQFIHDFKKEQFDTLCLAKELVETTEFQTLFRFAFPYRRYLSLFTIYMGNSFYQSIGNTGPIQEGGDRWVIPGGRIGSGFKMWDKEGFKGTANILRSVFMTVYGTKNKNVEPRNRDKNSRDDVSSFRELISDLVPVDLLEGIPWWQRKRRISKPFDMFDNQCTDSEDYF